jgi:hypothetical protein
MADQSSLERDVCNVDRAEWQVPQLLRLEAGKAELDVRGTDDGVDLS